MKLKWKKKIDEAFIDGKYSRVHTWQFDGGAELLASSSPEIVPVPMSDETRVDPEETFIASISACHMLFFLSIAAGRKYIVEAYEDHSEGTMDKDENDKLAIVHITLRPKVDFSGVLIPTVEQLDDLHRSAHARCYLANSVRSKIEIVPYKN